MKTRAIRAILRKDLKVTLQNKGVIIPLILVPLLLFVVLPLVALFVPSLVNMPGTSFTSIEALLQNMAPGLKSTLAVYSTEQLVIVLILVYFMAPMFLIVPLMVASVIAADSFAGEKERKTIEALLYTPTTDQELFLAKTLAAWLPALLITLIGFVLYSLVANLAGWSIMGMVLVSSRARGFQDAYQIGSVVVLPILLLVIGQATGVMYFNVGLVALLGLFFWILDVILFRFAVHTFQRGEIISRL